MKQNVWERNGKKYFVIEIQSIFISCWMARSCIFVKFEIHDIFRIFVLLCTCGWIWYLEYVVNFIHLCYKSMILFWLMIQLYCYQYLFMILLLFWSKTTQCIMQLLFAKIIICHVVLMTIIYIGWTYLNLIKQLCSRSIVCVNSCYIYSVFTIAASIKLDLTILHTCRLRNVEVFHCLLLYVGTRCCDNVVWLPIVYDNRKTYPFHSSLSSDWTVY